MYDFVLDTDGDLKITNGDLAIEQSDVQHQEDLLVSNKGDNKEIPAGGVGLQDYLNDDDIAGMLNEIRKQFKADGMTIGTLKYEGGKIITDASYS